MGLPPQLLEASIEPLREWRKKENHLDDDDKIRDRRGDTLEFDVGAIESQALAESSGGTLVLKGVQRDDSEMLLVSDGMRSEARDTDSGTMVVNSPEKSDFQLSKCAVEAAVPPFLRKFQINAPSGPSTPSNPSSRRECCSSSQPSGSRNGTPRVEVNRNKYDFSHLSMDEIETELTNLGSNLERDIGKLKRQYEKRQRALEAARQAKSQESSTEAV